MNADIKIKKIVISIDDDGTAKAYSEIAFKIGNLEPLLDREPLKFGFDLPTNVNDFITDCKNKIVEKINIK